VEVVWKGWEWKRKTLLEINTSRRWTLLAVVDVERDVAALETPAGDFQQVAQMPKQITDLAGDPWALRRSDGDLGDVARTLSLGENGWFPVAMIVR
jgi:hypothetical protein